jgi:hypothetical protein
MPIRNRWTRLSTAALIAFLVLATIPAAAAPPAPDEASGTSLSDDLLHWLGDTWSGLTSLRMIHSARSQTASPPDDTGEQGPAMDPNGLSTAVVDLDTGGEQGPAMDPNG